jgi:hypothetical protein
VAQLVPNPLHRALQDTLNLVEPLVQAVDRDLGVPCEQFRSGKVWTGPAARRFDQELAQYRARVRTATAHILADLRETLARTPREVPEDEARRIRERYNMP